MEIRRLPRGGYWASAGNFGERTAVLHSRAGVRQRGYLHSGRYQGVYASGHVACRCRALYRPDSGDPEELNGNRDIRMQSEKYRACLNTHENEDLVRLIKTVYRKNHRSMKAGRHMGSTDQQYVKRAEKLLYGELSVALGIGFEQVRPYIKKRIASVQA